MRVPRILLVDDERQVTRMLRTCLELSGRECLIAETPSAEEALLELGRGPVDVLVTDLVLPGMSGLHLLARVRQSNPEARAILITGHPSAKTRAEAEALGVIAYIPKPIRTNYFLEAVDRALVLSRSRELPVRIHEAGKAAMAEGLMAVLAELGAVAAYLIDDNAHLVVQAGDLADVNLKSALNEMVVGFRAGLRVSDQLGEFLPSNFQYFDGDENAIFLTNVGSYFALAIVFAAKLDVSRLDRVASAARHAADSILSALSKMAASGTGKLVAPEPAKTAEPPAPAEKAPVPGPKQAQKEAESKPAPASPIQDKAFSEGLEAAKKKVDRKQADQFWEQAASSPTHGPVEEGVIPFDEAKKRGLVPQKPEE